MIQIYCRLLSLSHISCGKFFAFAQSYYAGGCLRPVGVHVCVGSYKIVDTVEAETSSHHQADTYGLLLSASLQTLEVARWMRCMKGGGYCRVFPSPLLLKIVHQRHKGFVQYRSRTFVYIPQSDTSYLDPVPGHDELYTTRLHSCTTAVTLINKKRRQRATSRAKAASRLSCMLPEPNAV